MNVAPEIDDDGLVKSILSGKEEGGGSGYHLQYHTACPEIGEAKSVRAGGCDRYHGHRQAAPAECRHQAAY